MGHEQRNIMKMGNKSLFKYFISCGAVLYTLFSVSIMLISLMMSEDSASSILSPKLFLLLLLYMFVIALGNTVMRVEAISNPIKRLLHAISYIAGFFAFLLLCDMHFAVVCIFTAIFALIYAATVITTAFIARKTGHAKSTTAKEGSKNNSNRKGSKKKTVEDSDKYKSMFS